MVPAIIYHCNAVPVVEYIIILNDYKRVIFTGRPPLELSCLTRNTIRDARNILQI